jgi:hypothetical protein
MLVLVSRSSMVLPAACADNCVLGPDNMLNLQHTHEPCSWHMRNTLLHHVMQLQIKQLQRWQHPCAPEIPCVVV